MTTFGDVRAAAQEATPDELTATLLDYDDTIPLSQVLLYLMGHKGAQEVAGMIAPQVMWHGRAGDTRCLRQAITFEDLPLRCTLALNGREYEHQWSNPSFSIARALWPIRLRCQQSERDLSHLGDDPEWALFLEGQTMLALKGWIDGKRSKEDWRELRVKLENDRRRTDWGDAVTMVIRAPNIHEVVGWSCEIVSREESSQIIHTSMLTEAMPAFKEVAP